MFCWTLQMFVECAVEIQTTWKLLDETHDITKRRENNENIHVLIFLLVSAQLVIGIKHIWNDVMFDNDFL